MADPTAPRLAVILAADVVQDTRLMQSDAANARDTIASYQQTISDIIEVHHGGVREFRGDAVLAAFETALDALRCAVEIRRDVAVKNANIPLERRVELRIGIVDMRVAGDRVRMEPVDVAAWLAARAEAGGICITEVVRSAVGEELDLGFEFIGELSQPTSALPVRAYTVLPSRAQMGLEGAGPEEETASVSFRPDTVAPADEAGGAEPGPTGDVSLGTDTPVAAARGGGAPSTDDQGLDAELVVELPETLRAQAAARALLQPEAAPRPTLTRRATAAPPTAPSPAPATAAPPDRDDLPPKRSSMLAVLTRYALFAGGLALCIFLGVKLVPAIFGATASMRPRKSDESPDERHPVDCSVFSPPRLGVGDEILVQVFLHPPSEAETAEAYARRFDSDAEWRGFTSLSLDLASGTRVAVHLEIGDLVVSDDGIAQIRWTNGVAGVSFLVSAPSGATAGKRHGTARFFVEGVPAGRIHFGVELETSLDDEAPAEGLGDSSHRYRKAFISYASKDRGEVLKRVQTLGALKIDYFQDVLDLEPGDRWAQELYKEIDHCDLFLLFWSSASQGSKWVRKETQYALDRQSQSDSDEPAMIPMMIEGPPPPKPWPECAHLHFNDKLIYLMRYEEEHPDP